MSQGKASLAQSLVDFDPALAPAMQYTFGSSFICQASLLCHHAAMHPTITMCTLLSPDTLHTASTCFSRCTGCP